MNNAKITGTVTKEITVRGDVKHTYISSGGGGGGSLLVSESVLVSDSVPQNLSVMGTATYEEIPTQEE